LREPLFDGRGRPWRHREPDLAGRAGARRIRVERRGECGLVADHERFAFADRGEAAGDTGDATLHLCVEELEGELPSGRASGGDGRLTTEGWSRSSVGWRGRRYRLVASSNE
jgi:hypothetical protein